MNGKRRVSPFEKCMNVECVARQSLLFARWLFFSLLIHMIGLRHDKFTR